MKAPSPRRHPQYCRSRGSKCSTSPQATVQFPQWQFHKPKTRPERRKSVNEEHSEGRLQALADQLDAEETLRRIEEKEDG